MNDFDPIHNELVAAGRDLDRNVSAAIPPFKKRSDMPARIMVVAVTLVVAGIGVGGFLRFLNSGEETATELAGEGEETADFEEGPSNELESSAGIVVAKTDLADLFTDNVYRPRTQLDRPTTVQASRDEQFGVSIQAVTEAEKGESILPPSNAGPAWNIDGSRLVLYQTGVSPARYVLYDGETFEPIRALAINPLDVQEVYWDPTDSGRLYYVDADTFDFVAFDVNADTGEVVHNFDCDAMNGFAMMRLSADGRIFAHNCQLGSQRYYVAFDISTGEEVRMATDSVESPQPTPTSGLFIVNRGKDGTDVLDSSLNKVRSLDLFDEPDGVLIETPDKRDLYVTTVYEPESESEGDGVGTVVAFDLASGESQVVVGPKVGYPYPPATTAMTVSVGNSPAVVVSIVGTGTADKVLDGELLLVDFGSADPVVRRLGHHRTADSVEGLDGYFTRPGLAVDMDSRRLMFASSWGEDRVDSFVIDFD